MVARGGGKCIQVSDHFQNSTQTSRRKEKTEREREICRFSKFWRSLERGVEKKVSKLPNEERGGHELTLQVASLPAV